MHECDWLVSKIWWILSDTYPNDTCCDWVAVLISLPAVIVALMLFFSPNWYLNEFWKTCESWLDEVWMMYGWCLNEVWMPPGWCQNYVSYLCCEDVVIYEFSFCLAMKCANCWKFGPDYGMTASCLYDVWMMSEWCLDDVSISLNRFRIKSGIKNDEERNFNIFQLRFERKSWASMEINIPLEYQWKLLHTKDDKTW